ncbi:MAG: hypothetical protein KDC45_02595, partial [Bacteroidetes bacterium]|nr:hypothetical protein [Bacteroidota bacterium]
MRFVLVFCSLLASCGGMRGPTPIAQPSDVESVDAIMHSVYDVISGPVNAPRDWNRFRSLFVADARMIPIGLRKEGGYGSFTLTVEDYINRASAHFEKEAFYEKEISRKTEQF